MSIISQYSRISHHTITTGGTFSVPPTEDFTLGGTFSWNVLDLALSEIGVDESANKAFIRIGNNINEISLGGGGGGATGPQGATGPAGSNGATGPQGATGSGGGDLDDAYDFGGAGLGRTIIADSGAVKITGTDGILVMGTYSTGATPEISGAGTRMFFYPGRAAFRAGRVSGTQFDAANIGTYSVAFGYDNIASGEYSYVLGGAYNTATAPGSFIVGVSNNISGTNSYIIGGGNNTITAESGFIIGGGGNTISTIGGFIGGGGNNIIINEGRFSTILGGRANTLTGRYTAITGGDGNTVNGWYSFICGGAANFLTASFGFIGSGYQNNVTTQYSSIVGGFQNAIDADFTIICGGSNNTVTAGGYAFIGAGSFNNISDGYSSICGGSSNNISSGGYSSIVGGYNNTITVSNAFIGGGANNTVSSEFTSISGGLEGLAGRYGQRSYASGGFNNVVGSAQQTDLVLRIKTSNDTPTLMFLDEFTEKILVPADSIIACIINIAGVSDDGSEVAHYVRKAVVSNVSGTTTLVGSVSAIGTDVETSALLDATVIANDTDDSIDIEVTGLAATNMSWVASVTSVEIIYTA